MSSASASEGPPLAVPVLRAGLLSAPAFTLLVTGVAILLLAPNVLWPFHDAGIFGTVGVGLTHGQLPYRDLWDNKPPGIYLTAALAEMLPGSMWPAFWALSVGALVAIGLALRLVVGNRVAVLAVACLGLYPASLGGGHTEALGALPASTAVLAAIRGRHFVAGVLAACAALFSLQYLALGLAMLSLAAVVPYVAGGALVAGLTAGVMAAAGILPAAWDAIVVYGRAHLSLSAASDPAWYMAVILAPVGVLAALRGTWALNRIERMAVVWLLLGFLLLALQARHIAHYAAALVIPLALLGARARRRAVMTAFGTFAVAVVMTATITYYYQSGPATVHVGEWVRANTDPDDPILVWGVESNVYLVADRRPVGRFFFIHPLVREGYTTPAQIERWLDDLRSNPPQVIVDAEAANSHWPEGQDFLRPPPPAAAGGRTLDILGPFREWVEAHYVFAEEIDGRKIYVRSD
jgi:hypothetical protein